jgi:CHAD domain-containing protein
MKPPDPAARRARSRPDSATATAAEHLGAPFHEVRRLRARAAWGDPEALHDLRVALRRARVALRLFRPLLAETSAPNLERRLSRLSDELGPVRDAHVWLEYMERPSVRAALRNEPGIRALEHRFARLKEQNEQRAGRILNSARFRRALSALRRLLRHELSRLDGPGAREPVLAAAAPMLLKTVKKIRRGRGLANGGAPEALHEWRKAVRRGRYAAEFLAPAVGGWMAETGRALKRLASVLGEIHDMDMHLAERDALPAPLVRCIERDRLRSLRNLPKAWSRLEAVLEKKSVEDRLKKAARPSAAV